MDRLRHDVSMCGCHRPNLTLKSIRTPCARAEFAVASGRLSNNRASVQSWSTRSARHSAELPWEHFDCPGIPAPQQHVLLGAERLCLWHACTLHESTELPLRVFGLF